MSKLISPARTRAAAGLAAMASLAALVATGTAHAAGFTETKASSAPVRDVCGKATNTAVSPSCAPT
ncbi:hypothetical protein AB0O68_30460 [Streptomyces sp. NPDC087512]|uniref:hypothetical protein n=1 Tax=Streptomyces sp. NPDC087512 TaxID=3155059 RepID=UPI00341AD804